MRRAARGQCFAGEHGSLLGYDDLGSPLDRPALVIDLAVDKGAGVRTSASPQYTVFIAKQ